MGVRQLVGDEVFQSEEIAGPSNNEFFRSFFNPGHEGVASWIEYDFLVEWEHTAGGGAETLSYKIQYLEDGGSWTDLHSGTTGSLSPGYSVDEPSAGVVSGLSVTMPIAIRIIGTATNTWRIKTLGGESYDCFLRAVGSVS